MSHGTIPRIDPRRPWVVGPSGLKRIVLGAETGERGQLAPEASHGAQVLPLRLQGAAERYSLVVLHSDRGAVDEAGRQAIAAAALLADSKTAVLVLVLGSCHDELSAVGADVVLSAPAFDTQHFAPEGRLALIQAVVTRYAPVQLVMPDRGADAELGRLLATRQRWSVATDVVEVAEGLVRRLLPGARFAVAAMPFVLMLARNAVETRLPWRGQGEVQSLPAFTSPPERIRDLGVSSSAPDNLDLEEADAILSAGNGMRDMAGFQQLASLLGAATGASRVAVDDGRFPRSKQVGATGKTVQSSLYMAIGISGAVQHLQGIKECRHVVAINLDESAPIVKRANLSVIADSTDFMAALADLLKAARAKQEKAA